MSASDHPSVMGNCILGCSDQLQYIQPIFQRAYCIGASIVYCTVHSKVCPLHVVRIILNLRIDGKRATDQVRLDGIACSVDKKKTAIAPIQIIQLHRNHRTFGGRE